jgi:hypothetical protein
MILTIPHFLIALNRELLVKEMINNSIKDSINYSYFDIAKDGNFYVAWFNKEIKHEVAPIKETKTKKGKVI